MVIGDARRIQDGKHTDKGVIVDDWSAARDCRAPAEPTEGNVWY